MDEKLQRLEQAVQPLLAWYRANRRPLPWRCEPTPYHVWVSEIMLQQTRIEAVLSYYDRFLQEFPTVHALAAAPPDRLMKLWEGLGYYSRARNLQKAAVILDSEYGGRFPADFLQLRSLPGIGDYTAGAIASIAFGLPEPAVDGNVLRVLSRLLCREADIALPRTKQTAIDMLREVYPCGADAADLTQGLMELGEIICIPNGEPKCGSCPLRSLCMAHLQNATNQYPVKSPKKQRKIEERTVFLLSCHGKYALHRRDAAGLLAGLWEFPNATGNMNKREAAEYLRRIGVPMTTCIPCGNTKHIFTHIEWHMTGFAAECAEETAGFTWKTPEEIRSTYAIPSAFRFYADQV